MMSLRNARTIETFDAGRGLLEERERGLLRVDRLLSLLAPYVLGFALLAALAAPLDDALVHIVVVLISLGLAP